MNAFWKMKTLRVPAIIAMIIPCIYASAADPQDSIVCHIEGSVIDRPDSKVAFLMDADGVIVDADTTPETIADYLKENL